MAFSLPNLPYPPDALEKAIDKMTMEIHHDRHHKTYVDNLNKALQGTEWVGKPIEELLTNLDKIEMPKRAAVRNNGGGHYNHSLFWQIMSPQGGQPQGDLAEAIKSTFQDQENFQKQLLERALGQFGSGWAWLVVTKEKKLAIVSTPNQDTPFLPGRQGPTAGSTPILGVDVWEHAYYLRYQNKRKDYVEAWFKVVNWPGVAERFNKAMKG
jgi:Fe-Mn family superoxide dismutase